MAKVYAIINQKGGVGKTTTAFNMATELIKKEKRVLLMDMDPQGSLTLAMGFIPQELDKTVADLLHYLIVRQPLPAMSEYILHQQGLDMIPANITLSIADTSIVTATAREYLLKKIVALLRADYDYIIIDCPPTLGMLAINVLTAADAVIVPTKATELDTKGFNLLLDTVELVRAETNPKLEVEGVLLTMFDGRLKEAQETVSSLQRDCDEMFIPLLKTRIPASTDASRAFRERKPIAVYNPKSTVAVGYQDFVREVIEK